MSERIGVIAGGGDCPGLNAVIRSVAKAAARRGRETAGIIGGYDSKCQRALIIRQPVANTL